MVVSTVIGKAKKMKVSDIPHEILSEGIRVQDLNDPYKLGTIVTVEIGETRNSREPTSWIQWDGESEPTTGFFGNDCACEVVPQLKLEIDGSEIDIINCWWEGPNFVVHDINNKVFVYTNAWFSGSNSTDVNEGEAIISNFEFAYSTTKKEDNA